MSLSPKLPEKRFLTLNISMSLFAEVGLCQKEKHAEIVSWHLALVISMTYEHILDTQLPNTLAHTHFPWVPAAGESRKKAGASSRVSWMNRWGWAEVTPDHSSASAGPVTAVSAGSCLDPANPGGHPGAGCIVSLIQPRGWLLLLEDFFQKLRLNSALTCCFNFDLGLAFSRQTLCRS